MGAFAPVAPYPRDMASIALLPALLLLQAQDAPAPWAEVVSSALRGVVSIRSRIRYSVGRDEAGPFEGSGFVVDRERGLIATNRHVAGEGVVADLEVRFFDGTAVPAERLYADPLHDFAFLRFEPKAAPPDILEIPLDHEEPAMGAEVRMIGNNGGLAATVLPGTVSNLAAWWDQDPGVAYMQTSIASVGGSSGSPVLDARGRAVGLQTAHDDHNSYALPAEYLADALATLRSGMIPPRGTVGLRMRQIDLAEAVAAGAVSGDAARGLALQAGRELAVEPGAAAILSIVEGVVPDTPASATLQPGDAVVSIAGVLADDPRAIEHALDMSVGKKVTIRFYRNDVLGAVDLEVSDLHKEGVDRIALFCGAAFHDVSYEVRARTDLARRGALVSHVTPGSAAEAADLQRDDLILAIGGRPIADAAQLWRVFEQARHGDRLSLLVRRPASFDSATRLLLLTVDRAWDSARFLTRRGGRWSDSSEPPQSAPASRPSGAPASAPPLVPREPAEKRASGR